MNKQEITNLINSTIIDNDNGLITAEKLRTILNAMVEYTPQNEEINLDGYLYISTATPSTTPITLTEDNKVFYIATEEGDYSKFGLGNINELSVIKSNSRSWIVEGLGIELDIDKRIELLSSINGQVNMNYGAITTGVSVGTVVDIGTTIKTSAPYEYSIIAVKGGDNVHIQGQAGNSPRLWAFLDAEYKLISNSAWNFVSENYTVLTAPSNAAYCIVNRQKKESNKPILLSNSESEWVFQTKDITNGYSPIIMDDGVYWKTGVIGDTMKSQPESYNIYKSVKLECNEGDRFIINARASDSGGKPVAIADANNTIIALPMTLKDNSQGLGEYNGIITIPPKGKYIYINTKDKSLTSYKANNIILSHKADISNINDIIGSANIKQYRNENGTFKSFNIIMTQNDACPKIITTYAKYIGQPATLRIKIGDTYVSTLYILGGDNRYELKQYRVPPVLQGQLLEIEITAPDNCSLYIDNITYSKCSERSNWTGGLRLDSHLGFQSVAPENTLISFEIAAQCNYPACIVNPIRSADGTWYCYHEDDATLTLDGTTHISLSANEFNNLTDSQVSDYKVIGLNNLNQYKYFSEPIPTLEQFFSLCARTGMKPMFSTHPDPTLNGWKEIKIMLEKYNLLSSFTCKSASISMLEQAYQILGDIEGFILDVDGSTIDGNDLKKHCNKMSNSTLSNFTGRKGIEYPNTSMTHSLAKATIEEGYFPSVWSVGRINGARYYELMSWGCCEVTDDNNGSSGLNF